MVVRRLTDQALTCRRERVLASRNNDRIRAVLEGFHRLLELTVAMPTIADEQRNLVESEEQLGPGAAFVQCIGDGLHSLYQFCGIERLWVDIVLCSLDGCFDASFTLEFGARRLRQRRKCFVEPPT